MTKTIWLVIDESTNIKRELTYYHFGKKPQFPCDYLKANHVYTIEMIWNFKLVKTPKMFFMCLTHSYITKGEVIL